MADSDEEDSARESTTNRKNYRRRLAGAGERRNALRSGDGHYREYMYFEAFQKGSLAYGSAIAVVIGIVVLSVTWLQALLQSRVDRMTR